MEWLQGDLNVLICLFLWYGLVENVAKYKAMTLQPGTLRSRMSEEEEVWRYMVMGATYRKQLRRRIP